jgi:hypothetical protein
VPFKANAARRHRTPRQRHRVTNWAEYDAALRRRGSLTVWFTEEVLAAWRAEPRTTPGGQPSYSALAILTALTLWAVFRLALRQTEGLIGSILRLLGFDLAVPDRSTIGRRATTLKVLPRPRSGTGPLHPLVDSTGLKLGGAGEWLIEKHGTRRRRSWRKLHLGVETCAGPIEAVELTTNDLDDGLQVGPLLDQVTGPIASFTDDGAYDRDDVRRSVPSPGCHARGGGQQPSACWCAAWTSWSRASCAGRTRPDRPGGVRRRRLRVSRDSSYQMTSFLRPGRSNA